MSSIVKNETVKMVSKPKLWSKDYIIVMIASAGISFCNYFFFSTLPIYAQKISGTAACAGLMTGVYTLAALAVRPLSGILADKMGRTKLLILGALLCTIACALYNFASVLILLIFMRILHGIGFGMHSTSGGAVAADVIPKSRMAEGLGYFGLYGTIAAAVAPGIALSIIENGETQNFQTLFILAALVSFASMIIDCFITYERKNKKVVNSSTLLKNPAVSDSENLPKTFLGFEYAVFLPAAVLILLYIAMSSVTSFLPLFALEKHLGNIGLFFTINAMGLFLSRLLLGKVADKRGVDVVVIPSLIVSAICFVLIPFINSLFYLLLIAFPLGLAQGAIGPAINTLMFNRCSLERRGTASAAYFSSIDIGYGFGSVIAATTTCVDGHDSH
jgi:MFS family permease